MMSRHFITAILISHSVNALAQLDFELVGEVTPQENSTPISIAQPINAVAVSDTGGYAVINGPDEFFYADSYRAYRAAYYGYPPAVGNAAAVGVFPDSGAPGAGPGAWVYGFSDNQIMADTESVFADPDTADYFDQVDQALAQLFTFDFSVNGCTITRVSYNWEIHPVSTLVPDLGPGTLEFIPGVSYVSLEIFVHCMGRNNFVLYADVYVDPETRETEIELAGLAEATPKSAGATTKGSLMLPAAALPPGQASRGFGGRPVFAYLGQPVDGGTGFSALPTIVWLNSDLEPEEMLQLSDTPAGFASDLQICGQTSQDHLWLAFTDTEDHARLARIDSPDDFQVFDLGATTGFTALDCDTWGNAIAVFASPTGDLVNVRAFRSSGSNGPSASIPVEGGQSFLPVDVDMNHNGQAVVVWSTAAGIFHQRVQLNNVVEIDMSFAGSWNSPMFDGEGFIWDIADINGVRTLVLYYFTYRQNASGRQAWVVGSAPIENGIATVPMAITSGGVFGSAYDPDDVNAFSWGEIQVQIIGCTAAIMVMRSPLFGDHTYPARKFTASPPGLPGICADSGSNQKGAQIDGSVTGSWFNPDRNFEGFIFDVTNSNGQPTLVAYWFSYDDDGSGRQLWLVGAAPINGDTATVNLVRTNGPTYGRGFDPDLVAASSFATLTVTFNDCDNASVMYQVDGGESGSFDVQRLAMLPMGAGGVCGSASIR